MEGNPTQAQSVIAADMEITGNVKCASSMRVDGRVDGEVSCDKDAVIGKSAHIKGNIVAGSIVLEGTIQGNATARDRMELKTTAKMLGDIKAKRLVVEDGVTFVGRSEVNPSAAAPVEKPAPTPVPPPDPTPAESGVRGGIFGKR